MRSRSGNGRITSTRRWTVGLALVGMAALVAGASPAMAAKGGGKGAPEAPTVTVTMTGGIATDQDCGGPLTMTIDGSMLVVEWEDTGVEMPFLGLDGCHGPRLAGSDPGYPGNIGLAQERDGTVRLGSRFDYDWDFVTVGHRDRQQALDLKSIDGFLTPIGDFVWAPGGGGTLKGSLVYKTFHKVYPDMQGEWTEVGTFPVTFTVTIAPATG